MCMCHEVFLSLCVWCLRHSCFQQTAAMRCSSLQVAAEGCTLQHSFQATPCSQPLASNSSVDEPAGRCLCCGW